MATEATFTVENVASTYARSAVAVKSDIQVVFGRCWCVILYPNRNRETKVGHSSLFLALIDKSRPILTGFR
jgi:hypothetical protein